MTCKTCFKIGVYSLSMDEVDEIIDMLGTEPGITENFLYYGLRQKDTEEPEFKLFVLLNDTLSVLYKKEEILKKIQNMFPVDYYVDVRFSDPEDELERNTSFTISDESKDFIRAVGATYVLNNEFMEV